MRMALPSKKDVQYVKRKLRIWHEANKNHNGYPENEFKEFQRAVRRICDFFKAKFPKIVFYDKLGENTIGECTEDGELHLLTPSKYYCKDYSRWAKTFFHEFGHYIYYANAEKKAREFTQRMMDRW